MTGAYAQKILRKPVFGDETHIRALKVCHLLARLQDFRAQGDKVDIQKLAGFYALEELGESGGIPSLEDLPEELLEDEIDFWEFAMPWREQ